MESGSSGQVVEHPVGSQRDGREWREDRQPLWTPDRAGHQMPACHRTNAREHLEGFLASVAANESRAPRYQRMKSSSHDCNTSDARSQCGVITDWIRA